MQAPLITFLLIETAENSLSKFESSQAEITAFFQKIQIPIAIRLVRNAQDTLSAIQQVPTSPNTLIAIADSPVSFPLTHVLGQLQNLLSDPDPCEDLFFLIWDMNPPTSFTAGSYLEGVATTSLAPPHTAFKIETFPPLVITTSAFAQTHPDLFSHDPVWLRLALNLYAYANKDIVKFRREVLLGKSRPSALAPQGFLRSLKLWLQLQKLISHFRA